MAPRLILIGLEFVVEDLDRAVELWCDVLGFELLERRPANHVAGEAATIDAGSVVVTLLAPAASGPGTILAERTPRLGQIILGGPERAEIDEVLARAITGGLAAVPSGSAGFHLSPESIDGALGQPVAIVVTEVAST